MTLTVPVIHLKDKQAFEKSEGILRLKGNPVGLIKKMKDEGIKLVHIIDQDAINGLKTNLDIYNALTFVLNIEVEGVKDEKMIEKLLSMNARIVFELPSKFDLKKWKNKIRLLVGKIPENYEGNAEEVYDVIVEKDIEKFKKLGKRVIIYKKNYKKSMDVFAVLI